MGCVLRAAGKDFDVDAFLAKSKLSPCAVFRKGQPKGSDPKSKKLRYSAININVSNASFKNFKKQVKDAIKFLEENNTEIKRLARTKGLDGTPELDFGVEHQNVFVQSDCFPAELVSLAGKLGLGLMLSQYPVSDE